VKYLGILFLVLSISACSSGDDVRVSVASPNISAEGSSSSGACLEIGLEEGAGSTCRPLGAAPVVRVYISFDDGSQSLCSGTMLTSEDVLTAGHCFFPTTEGAAATAAHVVIGELATAQVVQATEVHTHPKVRGEMRGEVFSLINDIAVVKLAQQLSVPTLPILLSEELTIGQRAYHYGYGIGAVGGATLVGGGSILDQFDSSLIRVSSQLGEQTRCYGDSGGPLVVVVNGAPSVVGLISQSTRELDCDEGSATNPELAEGVSVQFTRLQSPEVLEWLLTLVPDAGSI